MTNIAKQTTFRHKLAYYAGLNYQEYEQMQSIYFERWCKKVQSCFFIDLETLTANDYLRNWYDDQWCYWVETRMKRRYNDDLDSNIFNEDDVFELIYTYQEDIETYPITLLKMIQKQTLKIPKQYENQVRKPRMARG